MWQHGRACSQQNTGTVSHQKLCSWQTKHSHSSCLCRLHPTHTLQTHNPVLEQKTPTTHHIKLLYLLSKHSFVIMPTWLTSPQQECWSWPPPTSCRSVLSSWMSSWKVHSLWQFCGWYCQRCSWWGWSFSSSCCVFKLTQLLDTADHPWPPWWWILPAHPLSWCLTCQEGLHVVWYHLPRLCSTIRAGWTYRIQKRPHYVDAIIHRDYCISSPPKFSTACYHLESLSSNPRKLNSWHTLGCFSLPPCTQEGSFLVCWSRSWSSGSW